MGVLFSAKGKEGRIAERKGAEKDTSGKRHGEKVYLNVRRKKEIILNRRETCLVTFQRRRKEQNRKEEGTSRQPKENAVWYTRQGSHGEQLTSCNYCEKRGEEK